MTMQIEQLAEDAADTIIRQAARNAAQSAYVASLHVAMELLPGKEADRQAERAKKIADWADGHGVKGPFITDLEKEQILNANIADQERQYLEAEAEKQGGNDSATPELHEKRKAALEGTRPQAKKGS